MKDLFKREKKKKISLDDFIICIILDTYKTCTYLYMSSKVIKQMGKNNGDIILFKDGDLNCQ